MSLLKDLKNSTYLVVSLAFIAGCRLTYLSQEGEQRLAGPITLKACFTPGGACQVKILSSIDKAESEIKVHAFSFTSKPIAEALLKAKRRGVDVSVMGDKGQFNQKYSIVPELKKQGIPVYIYPAKGYAHNKVLIIDKKMTVTGSYNWSHGAEYRNTENVLFIESDALAASYLKNWFSQMKKAYLFK